MMKNHACGENIEIWRNLAKAPILKCKTVVLEKLFCCESQNFRRRQHWLCKLDCIDDVTCDVIITLGLLRLF